MNNTDFITFKDVSYTYPALQDELDEEGNFILPKPVFEHFSATLPGGFVHLVGPNASGKSTFLLLASGRLSSNAGQVHLFGKDLAKMSEVERNLRASFIYQNMEFDTDDKTQELLEQVFMNGAFNGKETYKGKDLLQTVIEVFQLENVLQRSLKGQSKGEIQRVLLAFSLLYGSKSVFMDEPFFAMEYYQKEKALDFLKSYSNEKNIPMYISIHELELSKKYAEKVLLFYPNRDMDFGTPSEVLTKKALEKSYGVPVALLRDSEELTRKSLVEASNAIQNFQETLSEAENQLLK